MAHEGLETKQLTRVGRFQLHVMEDHHRIGTNGLGEGDIVDLWSNVADGWIRITSDHWGETTEAAIQLLVNEVPVPIAFEEDYQQFVDGSIPLMALVQWLAEKHETTTDDVLSELRTIIADME